MAYTSLNLITDAFYQSGVVSAEFQTLSGFQGNQGLRLLNECIAKKQIAKGLIPYYLKYTFNTVGGTDNYFIAGLEVIDSIVFFINSVRYQMTEFDRRQFFGSSRADNVSSLPLTWNFERQKGGGTLYLYFKPDTNYPMEIWGLFKLAPVIMNQDLELTFDDFYLNYLKYDLTKKICMLYDFQVPPLVQEELKDYELLIKRKSQQIDLQLEKISTLNKSSTLSYGQINLSPGWSPG